MDRPSPCTKLVQLSIHDWRGHFVERALQLLADRFPDGDHENRDMCQRLHPHAQRVL